jgi:asparagine synthase (glutamine-hydrolysing)
MRALLDADDPDVSTAMPPESSSWDMLSRAQWLEMTTLLPGYILSSQGDRMLMANSVEGRFPFLDKNVVAFANQLPARHKLFGLDEKFLLKRSFADLIPEAVRDRPKQPYRAPDAASFFLDGSPPDWMDDVLSPDALADCGFFDPQQVRGLLAKAQASKGRLGNTDNMRVLAVLSTQLIHRQFINPGPADRVSVPPEPFHVIDLVTNERGSDVSTGALRAGQPSH